MNSETDVRSFSWRSAVGCLLVLLCFFCASSEAVTLNVKQLTGSLMEVNSASDWLIQTFFIAAGYIIKYFVVVGID
jgi:hypothetical protein